MNGDSINAEYWEDLPPGCPPAEAVPPAASQMIRLAKTDTPAPDCFVSHAAKGLPIRGGASPCAHASCSLFYHDREHEQINAMRRLPRFKNFTHAFLVEIDDNSGMGLAGHGKHLDLWMFKSFDPVAAVVSVEPM